MADIDGGMPPPAPRPPGEDRPENRKHGRRRVAADVGVELDGIPPFSGRSRDLSFGGAFVECDPPPVSAGTPGRLTLTPDDAPDEVITFVCRVMRIADGGIGFRLLETDPAGHERFSDLMRRAGSIDPLLNEIRVSSGFSVSTSQGMRRALD
ncbi:MAG: PilZ domain-containing protein [Nitrospirota bacterium]|nr:PilZ domain-containing protein [Nitrospirota bacterium]